ncbi:ABC-2 type transport system ATP-binding protein [Nocardioides albertanoniae]|uniref:ABC-2 type transport system ATP-binding protein n=1 Tax=Nocardioides albertanoniae TaxID=1175486 RepID=A0A543AA91_9ACTN|nr:ATP-binding cassette domain-containing protein [Nocardioides albertanoniae]TQL69511.1 ABC-2 type transport system ATP-binding protein [Nocardioides albertanoniae]
MIQIDALSKRYGRFTAVDNVTFNAEPGRVTGFLGPNGAGKSTTMRILVGLTDPSSGSAHLLGRHFSQLPNPGLEVGVLLDASAQHGGRTGREILTLAARTMGLPKSRVAETLERVSLSEEEAGRRVRNYSLGMRQRLGIATALIGDPEVLILDEPANGLDPAGIRWMRDLLRRFADDGGTVLLSSHLLHEIEVIADDIVVIGNGRIVAQGTKQELLASGETYARTGDPTALGRALQRAGHNAELTTEGAVRTGADLATVGQVAFDSGLVLTELRAADGSGLEEMFLQLTAETQRDHLDAQEGKAA